MITRFAPSPTGRLHRGHAFSALTAYTAATAASGRFLLRIEDIDETRCRPEYEAAIYEDLAWLGLDWEEPVRRQSEHLPEYRAVLERLKASGLVYPCTQTRRQALAASAGAPQAGDAPDIRDGAGGPVAWRLDLAAADRAVGGIERLAFTDLDRGEIPVDPARVGEVILGRKDVGVSYHLASVWDDALQGVTHVIRGEDLSDAAHVHRLLQALLDLPTPVYRHHPLLLRADGKRFAKRDEGETLAGLRARGVTAEALRAELGC